MLPVPVINVISFCHQCYQFLSPMLPVPVINVISFCHQCYQFLSLMLPVPVINVISSCHYLSVYSELNITIAAPSTSNTPNTETSTVPSSTPPPGCVDEFVEAKGIFSLGGTSYPDRSVGGCRAACRSVSIYILHNLVDILLCSYE